MAITQAELDKWANAVKLLAIAEVENDRLRARVAALATTLRLLTEDRDDALRDKDDILAANGRIAEGIGRREAERDAALDREGRLRAEVERLREGEAGDYWAVAEERDAEHKRAGEYALERDAALNRVARLRAALARSN